MDGFVKFSTRPFTQQPVFDAELIDWFITVLQLLEKKSEATDFSIAERFRHFVKTTAPYDIGVNRRLGVKYEP
jgi:hypothetical protein